MLIPLIIYYIYLHRDLPNLDIWEGAPDGYAIVYYAATNTDSYSRVGETINISNNNNPDWSEVLNKIICNRKHKHIIIIK
jgi:hypothetical protein